MEGNTIEANMNEKVDSCKNTIVERVNGVLTQELNITKKTIENFDIKNNLKNILKYMTS